MINNSDVSAMCFYPVFSVGKKGKNIALYEWVLDSPQQSLNQHFSIFFFITYFRVSSIKNFKWYLNNKSPQPGNYSLELIPFFSCSKQAQEKGTNGK